MNPIPENKIPKIIALYCLPYDIVKNIIEETNKKDSNSRIVIVDYDKYNKIYTRHFEKELFRTEENTDSVVFVEKKVNFSYIEMYEYLNNLDKYFIYNKDGERLVEK